MENKEITAENARILNVILLESNFKRVPQVTFDINKIENEINLDVDVQVKDNMIYVTETVIYNQRNKEPNSEIEVTSTIKYLGIFEILAEMSNELKESFGKINGGAIIFPFIREHVATLSQKASINTIILPPFNFTSFGKTELKIDDKGNKNL